ncbi:hypothetical protein [Nocardia camponoti]|uniref:hypothetical protein n=1 Tax=Nocardia camponoti TaxID=1616106 RepID=UPI00166DA0A4|nr:hypothetical protein [Nocardia camponoti]
MRDAVLRSHGRDVVDQGLRRSGGHVADQIADGSQVMAAPKLAACELLQPHPRDRGSGAVAFDSSLALDISAKPPRRPKRWMTGARGAKSR